MSSRTPDSKAPESLPPQRRHGGGTRKPASDRVRLRRGDQELIGWALNVSRGGIRVVLEEPVELHVDYSFLLGDDDEHPRPVRVAWVKDEAGGQIAGLQFLDGEGTVPPADIPTE